MEKSVNVQVGKAVDVNSYLNELYKTNYVNPVQPDGFVPTFEMLEIGAVVDYHDFKTKEYGRVVVLDSYPTKHGMMVNILWVYFSSPDPHEGRLFDRDCMKGDVLLDGTLWSVVFG